MYRLFFKRFFDIILSSIALIIVAPILLITCIGLLVINNGKVFFLQTRPGKNAKTFTIIKFKTMTDQKDKNGNLLSDHLRLTKIGYFIRSVSIDELPQLFNILKGDMSFVGPRPLLPKYIPLYSKEQARRHEVRPGLTGWSQINGRNNLSWKTKFELDVWYVDNLSFLLDIKIVLITIIKVLKKQDISKKGLATSNPFLGNN